jgi:O-antigen/teichoic acid export membrane protein
MSNFIKFNTLAKLTLTRASNAFGQFLLLFVLSRHAGSVGVGGFAVGQGLALALGLFSHLGLNSAILKVASRSPTAPNIQTRLIISLTIAFLFSSGLAAGTYLLSGYFSNQSPPRSVDFQ